MHREKSKLGEGRVETDCREGGEEGGGEGGRGWRRRRPAAARRSMKPRRTKDSGDASVTSMTFRSARHTANFPPHDDATASVTGEGRLIAGDEEPVEETVMMRPSDRRTRRLPGGG
jgi:hypothetical protein